MIGISDWVENENENRKVIKINVWKTYDCFGMQTSNREIFTGDKFVWLRTELKMNKSQN